MIRFLLAAGVLAITGPDVRAEPHMFPQMAPSPPFVTTLSNTAPLQFGLTAEQTATALGVPLAYVSGRPGHEIFLAMTTGGYFFARQDAIFLQFRKGRLTGWKSDRVLAASSW
jgi:hypothetical protein